METLWNNLGKIRFVDWILIQCYMGWRPQELAILEIENVDLENWAITGGMKTEAGRYRTIPIHTRIRELVQKNYNQAIELGSNQLFNDPDAVKGGMKITSALPKFLLPVPCYLLVTYGATFYDFSHQICILKFQATKKSHSP